MINLAGKVALVTGASSGIGRQTAQKLHALGMKVVLVGRDKERLAAVENQLGKDAHAVVHDLADFSSISALVEASIEKFGALDVLIANAGVFNTTDVVDTSPEVISQMIEVNLTSVMLLAQAALVPMIKQKSGEILAVGSIAGISDMRNEAVYSASKHGLNAFLRSLRRQVQNDGVRVGSILPGTVATELWGSTDPAEISKAVDAGDVLRAEDIADIIVFMLSQPPNVAIRELVVLPQSQDL